MIYKAP